jgi:hypothetical protein
VNSRMLSGTKPCVNFRLGCWRGELVVCGGFEQEGSERSELVVCWEFEQKEANLLRPKGYEGQEVAKETA